MLQGFFFPLGFAVTFPNKLLYKNRQYDMHAAAVLLLTVLANFHMQLLDFCGVVLKSAANCHAICSLKKMWIAV